VHVYGSIVQLSRFAHDPWFILEGPGLGLIAAALSVWAWRLLRQLRRA